MCKASIEKKGLGGRLLKEFELSAKNKGCEIVDLSTGKQVNIDYYYKQGYEKNHTLQPFTDEDDVYNYYYNIKCVSLLMKVL